MMKDPVNFHRGKPHHVFAFQIIPMFCSLLFLLILSSSSVVGFSYLKAHSLSMKHLMLEALGLFCSNTAKQKKPPVLCFVLGCFLGVVLVKCSVYFLLSPATTIFWKDELCLQMFIKQVLFLYNSMLDFSMLTFKRKY